MKKKISQIIHLILDELAKDAIEKYYQDKTKSLQDFAKEHNIQL